MSCFCSRIPSRIAHTFSPLISLGDPFVVMISHIFLFWWLWQFSEVLVRNFVQNPLIWVCLGLFSSQLTQVWGKKTIVNMTYGYWCWPWSPDWDGIFQISPLHMCYVTSVVSDSFQPHGQYPTRLLCPWDSPGKNTGVGCRFLLQGVFPIQGSNLPLWRSPALAGRFFTTSATWEAHCSVTVFSPFPYCTL